LLWLRKQEEDTRQSEQQHVVATAKWSNTGQLQGNRGNKEEAELGEGLLGFPTAQ
jgi:hypothetical protein